MKHYSAKEVGEMMNVPESRIRWLEYTSKVKIGRAYKGQHHRYSSEEVLAIARCLGKPTLELAR